MSLTCHRMALKPLALDPGNQKGDKHKVQSCHAVQSPVSEKTQKGQSDIGHAHYM